MTGLALALTLAALAGAAPAAAPAVRLTPIRCEALSDDNVRAALKVELRERLLDEAVPPPDDFVLVSVSCESDHANLLAVRHGAGAPVRRLVVLDGVAMEARPRATALAIAELLRVDAIRTTASVPTSVPPVVEQTAAVPPPSTAFSISASYVWLQALESSYAWSFKGSAFRFAVEPGGWNARVGWGWAASYQLSITGPDNAVRVMNQVLALAQRRGRPWVPELGIGARVGPVLVTHPTNEPLETHLAWGPVASVATEYGIPGTLLTIRGSVQGGYDLRYGGAWAGLYTGFGLRW
jgi:hypothetical protein